MSRCDSENDTSIAVGADYYKLNDLVFNTQQIDINGSGADWGWNVGLQHVAGPWSFGPAYRSKVSVNVDGTVDATRTRFTRASATSKLEFPDMWQAGARYRVNDRLALEFDYERIGWSSFDKLTITTTAVPFPIVSTNNWQDSDIYRLGATYQLYPKTQLRFGFSLDKTPQPDAHFSVRVPDADRQLLSAGFAHDCSVWTLEGG